MFFKFQTSLGLLKLLFVLTNIHVVNSHTFDAAGGFLLCYFYRLWSCTAIKIFKQTILFEL